MKGYFFIALFSLLYLSCPAQKLRSGTYTFNYCDLEYNMCLGPCKVVIKGDSIIIYATKELAQNRTFTKAGDIIDRGIILQHKTGKWIVAETSKDARRDEIGYEGPAILDIKKKQYWTF